MSEYIRYDLIKHPKYKYLLKQDYTHKLFNSPTLGSGFPEAEYTIDGGHGASPVAMLSRATLLIRNGYAWDGSTGPALDTVNFMRGSLVHDALYQIIPTLPGAFRKDWKRFADAELVRICGEDGMSWIRRQWVHAGVRLGGRPGKPYEPLAALSFRGNSRG